MVPYGPVTKSQSGIMPNVAHNGRANTFSQLINPSYTLYFVTFQRTFLLPFNVPFNADSHRQRPLASISSCKAPIIDDIDVSNTVFEGGVG